MLYRLISLFVNNLHRTVRPLYVNDLSNKVSPVITGRNRTGPLCSVGRPTAHAPGGSVTDDDRHQRAKQYGSIRRASNTMASLLSSVAFAFADRPDQFNG